MATPQQMIGHFRISAKLGAGGMGEVWRATDTRLNREVAIKVLPAAFAGDPLRMARFKQEAQVLASLNHPGIATIHGVEDNALVMELVEGPTLAERIAKGKIPLDEALPIATQIADALEYAHERGVVHRDLKPANIKVTPEGRVKVLDFGLAKLLSSEPSPSSADAATLTSPATMVGTILGTAAYMSPEQAKGKPVDRRADIWAFGAVLYEMLTGERAFPGEGVTDTLASVLRAEPDLSPVPEQVRAVIGLCLQKDPRERWGWVGDVRRILQQPPAQGIAPIANRRLNWVWAAALAATAFAGIAAWLLKPAPRSVVTQFTLAPPGNSLFTPGVAAVSPDGRRLLFGLAAPGGAQLWLRPLEVAAAQALPATRGIGTTDGSGWSSIFWSPDGQSVGYFANGNLMRVDVNGGTPVNVTHTGGDAGGSWSRVGVIVYGNSGNGQPLFRVSAGGGDPVPATALDTKRGETRHIFPWFLPDGNHFLFYANGPNLIEVASLRDAGVHIVGPADTSAIYDSGHLIYQRNGVLVAQPFDLRRLVTTGVAVPIAGSVAVSAATAQHAFFGAAGGTLFYQPGDATAGMQLVWFDTKGGTLGSLGEPAALGGMAVSPDGGRAVVTVLQRGGRPSSDLWVYDLTRNVRSRLTFDTTAQAMIPVWSPDGRQVAYRARRGGNFDLYSIATDGSGTETLLYADATDKSPASWSRDNKNLLYNGKGGTWLLPLQPQTTPRLLLPAASNAQFSPDSRWVAYQSNISGRNEVYLTPFPGSGGKYLVSEAGGLVPRWRSDGKALYYVGPGGWLMLAPLDLASTPAIGAVRLLFGPIMIGGGGFRYDVSADGQRILAESTRDKNEPGVPLTIVANWPAALGH